MPPIPIPLPALFSRSSDETSLPDQVGARGVNVWIEKIQGKVVIRKSPGLEQLFDLGMDSPIDCIAWWPAKEIAIAVSGGHVFTLDSLTGNATDITGDALSIIGPTTFTCNQYQAILASGGRMVGINVENLPDTTPALAIGSTPANVYSAAFDFYIGQSKYSKAEVAAGTAPGNDTIPQGKYGAVAFDIESGGTITAVEASDNATGYRTAAQAIAGLPKPASTKARMGVVTAMMDDDDFVFGTDALDDAHATVEYHSYIRDGANCHIQPTYFISDADAPTEVTHVGILDGYGLANKKDTGLWYYSDADDFFVWQSLSFAGAEGKPDFINALHVAWLEITLFGTESIETWYDDGVTPFKRIDGGVLEQGTDSPYTIVNANGAWIWLTTERHVVRLVGRQWAVVSGPYDSEIGEITDVSSAWAIFLQYAGQDFYVLTFPSVSRTYVWNITTDSWTEWGIWDSDTATFGMWPGKSHCYHVGWKSQLVGSPTDSIIYRVKPNYFQIGTTNIRSLMRTAHITHGTTEIKNFPRLIIDAKRGQGVVGGDEPVFTMRHKSDHRGWSNEVQVGLGLIGEEQSLSELRRIGQYMKRQWEIVHSDNSDFILNGLFEATWE